MIRFQVNGVACTSDAADETPLLYVLRNDLLLKGTRFGCGQGGCGACTVQVDGRAALSCDTPMWAVAGKSVKTIEGLESALGLSRLQQAFLDEQAGQCGYCLSGVIMAAQALLDRNPCPTRAQICEAIDGHLCRCGSHLRILRAIELAVRRGSNAAA
ncbi:MAG: 2Fe-2S iron-sulfur cluster-binding protein [Caldimonas sp.]